MPIEHLHSRFLAAPIPDEPIVREYEATVAQAQSRTVAHAARAKSMRRRRVNDLLLDLRRLIYHLIEEVTALVEEHDAAPAAKRTVARRDGSIYQLNQWNVAARGEGSESSAAAGAGPRMGEGDRAG